MLVGERGESLSGGQRQAVAVARALIADPPILLLDEPTAAMDHASEEALKQQLREHAAGKTMIVVTHRTSLLDLDEISLSPAQVQMWLAWLKRFSMKRNRRERKKYPV